MAVRRVPVSLTSVLILGLDSTRLGFEIYNDADVAVLKIKVGDGPVSALDFTSEIGPYGTYTRDKYGVGPVFGLWDVADGDGGAQVTEFF